MAVEVEQLSLQGLTTLPPATVVGSPNAESGQDTLTNSTVLLASMNVSIESTLSKTFSLKDTQTDTETVANPNLKDPNVGKSKKKNIKATDKFPCASDSFYNLDDAPDERQRNKTKELVAASTPTTAIEVVAQDLVLLGTALSIAG